MSLTDVSQLVLGVQLLVQHVDVKRDLIEQMSEEFLIPDFMPFAFAEIACQLLVRRIHSTHLVIVHENGFRLHFFAHETTEWKPFDLYGGLTAQQHYAYLSRFLSHHVVHIARSRCSLRDVHLQFRQHVLPSYSVPTASV